MAGRVAHNVVFADPAVFEAFDLAVRSPPTISAGCDEPGGMPPVGTGEHRPEGSLVVSIIVIEFITLDGIVILHGAVRGHAGSRLGISART